MVTARSEMTRCGSRGADVRPDLSGGGIQLWAACLVEPETLALRMPLIDVGIALTATSKSLANDRPALGAKRPRQGPLAGVPTLPRLSRYSLVNYVYPLPRALMRARSSLTMAHGGARESFLENRTRGYCDPSWMDCSFGRDL
jgi:hypothetical protein